MTSTYTLKKRIFDHFWQHKMEQLLNKKVLAFIPSFFSYESLIKEAMEKMGAKVWLFNERSVTSPLSRAMLKICPSFFKIKTRKYYGSIVDSLKDTQFDYILIIRGDMIDRRIISILRNSFPKAKLCLHLWDSVKNIKGILNILDSFDYISSFDSDDCKKYPLLNFRPLFFANEAINAYNEYKYDLVFCGTVHSDRYDIINKVFSKAKSIGLKTFSFLYLPSKFMFFYYKFFARGFKKAKLNEFSYLKKNPADINNIVAMSNVILDIQHPKQSGLTMRTIEMIGAKKKIITTNQQIINYDFYNPNNILVISRNDPQFDSSFFTNKYVDVPNEILKKYTIYSWIIDVLGC